MDLDAIKSNVMVRGTCYKGSLFVKRTLTSYTARVAGARRRAILQTLVSMVVSPVGKRGFDARAESHVSVAGICSSNVLMRIIRWSRVQILPPPLHVILDQISNASS